MERSVPVVFSIDVSGAQGAYTLEAAGALPGEQAKFAAALGRLPELIRNARPSVRLVVEASRSTIRVHRGGSEPLPDAASDDLLRSRILAVVEAFRRDHMRY